MSRINQQFGEILQKARHQKKMTQETLAEKAGIHRNHISFMERGLRSPTLDTLFQICLALDIEVSKLLAELEDKLREQDIQ